MLYRPLPDLDPPTNAVDAPDLARADAVIALSEQHQRMLGRIAEVGMAMIETLARNPEPDAAGFSKVSQAVRRTLALQMKLAREANADRDAADAQRTRRRADAAAAHKAAKETAIIDGLQDAYFGAGPETDIDPEGDIFDRMMDVDTERLDDYDEFAGYLDRPVGETVARLCAAIGLDPDACAHVDGAWRVRAPPFTRFYEEDTPHSTLPPVGGGEGGSEHSDETGGERRSGHDPTVIGEGSISDAAPQAFPPSSTLPHPDAFGVCPSP